MDNNVFGNRLRSLLEEKEIEGKDFAKIIHVEPPTISNWLNGKRFPKERTMLLTIANYFNVSTDYLLGHTDKRNNIKKSIRIPVLGSIAAGIPINAITDIVDYEEIEEAMSDKGDYIGLKIKGNSMTPRIQDGDIVIIKKQQSVYSGEIAAVLINGNDATLKKVEKNEDGILLISYNHEAYPPKFFSNKQIEELPIIIIGRVVELRGKF